jgi:hypothetical protein
MTYPREAIQAELSRRDQQRAASSVAADRAQDRKHLEQVLEALQKVAETMKAAPAPVVEVEVLPAPVTVENKAPDITLPAMPEGPKPWRRLVLDHKYDRGGNLSQTIVTAEY